VDKLDIVEHEANMDTHADHWRTCVLNKFIDPFETVSYRSAQDRALNFRSGIGSVAGVQINAKPFDEVVTLHVPQVNDPRKPDWLPAQRTIVTLWCCGATPDMLPTIEPLEGLNVSMLLRDNDERPSWRTTIALLCEPAADVVETR